MQCLNKYNLPERVIRMLSIPRKPVEGRFSVTNLIEEPLPRRLLLDNWDDVVIDYSDLLMSFQGIAMHRQYEKFAKDDEEVEHKIETPIDDVMVVGKADNYFDKNIIDVKQTKIWSPTYPSTIKKWTAQLNVYAWQHRLLKQEVKKLLIDVWYKNWSITTKQYTKDYPECAYEEIELALWSFEEQEKYVKGRLEAHKNPKECSTEQKWQRIEVRKEGRKSPLKVCDTFVEAENWAKDFIESEKTKKVKVYTELSEPLNCKYFCLARSICPYAKTLK